MLIQLYETPEEKCVIPKSSLNDHSLSTLLEYSCWMHIEIGGKVFYDDGICPLEMRYAYKCWLDELYSGNMQDFIYLTEDDGHNPFLQFCYHKEGWTIHSCFEQYYEPRLFSTQELLSFFEMFENELNKFIV